LIEVKTTRFGALTPFFASSNEVEVSDRRNADYQLYRVFKFSEQPKLFMLPGSLRRSCRLDLVTYAARVA
jgi:Protein NO VEIN, C-terminal